MFAGICREQRCFLESAEYDVKAWTTPQHHNILNKMHFDNIAILIKFLQPCISDITYVTDRIGLHSVM